MKSIKTYITESADEHAYILKLAVEPTSEQVDKVKSVLAGYNLIHFSPVKMAKDEKFDFFDINASNVWSIRFVTGTPLSSYIIMQYIKAAIDINEKYIIVRTSNEPVEVEAEDERFKQTADADAAKDGLAARARLSINRFYDAAEQPLVTDLYGNDYNKKFLNYLASVKTTRDTDHVEAPMPLFGWLKMADVKPGEPTQDTADFNAQYDTPKPVSKPSGDANPIDPTAMGSHGELDDGAAKNVRLFVDPRTGKESAFVAARASKKAKR